MSETPRDDASVLRRPASRYNAKQRTSGMPQPQRSQTLTNSLGGKILVVLLVLLVAGLVGAVGRWYNNRGHVETSAEMTSFERVDDNHIELQIDVQRKNTEVASYCIVTAMNYDMVEVGRREVLIPAGGAPLSRHKVVITTRDLPVSGGVYGCSTKLPFYMDL